MKKKKVVVYCRTASITKNIDVLDIQKENLKEYAKKHDYEITMVIM
ncbi:MAG: hypothetical protein ACI4PR_05955 [Acutalibacteraceae bacterium]